MLRIRTSACAVLALTTIVAPLTAQTEDPYPEPPASLASNVEDGTFYPRDFLWMRGAFGDATPEEKAGYQAISHWLDSCGNRARADMTDRLAQMGRPGVKLDNALVEPLLCKQVRAASAVKDAGRFTSYAELSAVHERVRPIADSYIGAVGVAETSAGGVHNRDLKGRLLTRPLGEQILRRGMSWGSGAMAHMPRLNEEERAILSSLLLIQTQQRDVWNTAWLRDVVDKEGWPTISDVGPDAAQQAWLIAQHADQDPVFQLQALQMMEPLVDAGEVSKPDFAYLYDRIMLKLVGKQRYATQMTCRDGKRQPQPLEDAPAVNEWRQSANLGSLEDYLDTMNRRFGPCPAE